MTCSTGKERYKKAPRMEGRAVELLKGKPVQANLAEEPAATIATMGVKSCHPTALLLFFCSVRRELGRLLLSECLSNA